MKKRILLIPTLLAFSCAVSASVQFANPNGSLGEPTDYPQFSNILSASELQISDPEGKKSNKEFFAIDNNYKGIVNQNFYVDKETEAFVFKMKNDHLRNELRIQKNFRTDLPDAFYKLTAEVEIISPEESVKDSNSKQNEITFLQVHNKGLDNNGTHNVPHPLLRIVWKENKQGIKGHFWAVTKNNAVICKGSAGAKNKDKEICDPSVAYSMVDLGKAPSNKMTKFDITVGNKTLAINVNDERKVEKNIDYWRHLLSFFKAGVYNQFSNGQSEAHFKTLKYAEITK